MILVPNLNLFDTNVTVLGNSSQTANEGVNALNTSSVVFDVKRTISRLFILLHMNFCILPL